MAEFYDRTVHLAGSILSGHTIKHLAAAAACFAILRYFQTRRPITRPYELRSQRNYGYWKVGLYEALCRPAGLTLVPLHIG